MAAAAVLKIHITLTATTQSPLHICIQTLAQRLKLKSRKQKYLQISLPPKSKMAANRLLENT